MSHENMDVPNLQMISLKRCFSDFLQAQIDVQPLINFLSITYGNSMIVQGHLAVMQSCLQSIERFQSATQPIVKRMKGLSVVSLLTLGDIQGISADLGTALSALEAEKRKSKSG